MSISYKLSEEFTNNSFNYGGAENLIGFISDNYYEAMKIYRTIVKQEKEADKKREQAHQELQKLRDDEERWRKENKIPSGFDAEQHTKRKEHLSDLREAQFTIIYNEKPLTCNKLTYLIINKRWIFKILDKIDIKGRNRLGPLASKSLSILLWPMAKMMQFTAKHTDSLETEKFMKKSLKDLKSVPGRVKEKIVNV